MVNWPILLPCNSELFNNRTIILTTQECLGIISQQIRAIFKPFIPQCPKILGWVNLRTASDGTLSSHLKPFLQRMFEDMRKGSGYNIK